MPRAKEVSACHFGHACHRFASPDLEVLRILNSFFMITLIMYVFSVTQNVGTYAYAGWASTRHWTKCFTILFSNRKYQQSQLLPTFLPYRIPREAFIRNITMQSTDTTTRELMTWAYIKEVSKVKGAAYIKVMTSTWRPEPTIWDV
jgi:hypothetical protein